MSDNKSNASSPADSIHSDIHCWYDRMTFFHSLDDDSHGPNFQLTSGNSESNSNLNNVSINDTPNNNNHNNNNRIIEDRVENEEAGEHQFQSHEENELEIDEEFWRTYRERKNRWNRITIKKRHPPPAHWTR